MYDKYAMRVPEGVLSDPELLVQIVQRIDMEIREANAERLVGPEELTRWPLDAWTDMYVLKFPCYKA